MWTGCFFVLAWVFFVLVFFGVGNEGSHGRTEVSFLLRETQKLVGSWWGRGRESAEIRITVGILKTCFFFFLKRITLMIISSSLYAVL